MLTSLDFHTLDYAPSFFKGNYFKVTSLFKKWYVVGKFIVMGPYTKSEAYEHYHRLIPMYKHVSQYTSCEIYEFYNQVQIWNWNCNRLEFTGKNFNEALEFINSK